MQINAFAKKNLIPQEESVKKPFFVGLASLCVAIFSLAFFWPSLPPEIPLFYSKPWGENQLVPSYFAGLPLLLGAILLFTNSAFAQTLDGYPLIRRLLVFGGSVVCVFAAITVIRIILITI